MLEKKLDQSIIQMEHKINDVFMREAFQMIQEKEKEIESRLFELVDNQARDIATDYQALHNQVGDLKT